MYCRKLPNKCIKALQWLLQNSFFVSKSGNYYQDWNIQLEQQDWLGFDIENNKEPDFQSKTDQQESLSVKKENEDNECFSDDTNSDVRTEDPNFESRLTGNTDTLLHLIDVRSLCKTMSFSPSEGQTTLGLYQNKYAEILSFPTIYCGQLSPENNDHDTPVHYSFICKWELRSIDRRAASSIPNIFFKLKKIQVKQTHDKVSPAMRKCQTGRLLIEMYSTLGNLIIL